MFQAEEGRVRIWLPSRDRLREEVMEKVTPAELSHQSYRGPWESEREQRWPCKGGRGGRGGLRGLSGRSSEPPASPLASAPLWAGTFLSAGLLPHVSRALHEPR